MPEENENSAVQAEAALLAAALREALGGMTIRLDGEAVGRLVAPVVDRELGLTVRSGRFA